MSKLKDTIRKALPVIAFATAALAPVAWAEEDAKTQKEEKIKTEQITDGIRKLYHENGALKRETPYVDGERHGIDKCYNEDGSVWAITPYEKGKINGVQQFFNKDGSLWGENIYEQGKKVGEKRYYYDENGKRTEEILYKGDQKIRTTIVKNVVILDNNKKSH